MALSNPPSLPGGGVIWVKTWGLSAPNPLNISVPRIQTKAPRPISIAAMDSASPTRLATIRLR